MVNGDKNKLGQVLINLINNAIKYSPAKKKIIIRIKKRENQLIVSVRDFGMGIPLDSQKKIFKKFCQLKNPKNKVQGLGLGLYISSRIIEEHQGKIWVKSKEGKGATFYFSIPAKAT